MGPANLPLEPVVGKEQMLGHRVSKAAMSPQLTLVSFLWRGRGLLNLKRLEQLFSGTTESWLQGALLLGPMLFISRIVFVFSGSLAYFSSSGFDPQPHKTK